MLSMKTNIHSPTRDFVASLSPSFAVVSLLSVMILFLFLIISNVEDGIQSRLEMRLGLTSLLKQHNAPSSEEFVSLSGQYLCHCKQKISKLKVLLGVWLRVLNEPVNRTS